MFYKDEIECSKEEAKKVDSLDPVYAITLCKNIACVQYGTVDATYDFTSQTKWYTIINGERYINWLY